MPDLDAIHYKFFPKAKTAPWGKKLIVMAWIIEILVASVSFAIAMIFFLSGGDSNLKVAQLASNLNVNSVVVGLSFLVVTVVELTKIPLASVFYYAGKISWRIVFFLALLAVNFLTFETIMQGFQLAYDQRNSVVNEIRKEVDIKKDEIENINTKSDSTELDKKIEIVRNDIKSKTEEKIQIEEQRIEEKNKLVGEANVANPNIERLNKAIERETNNKLNLEKSRETLNLQINNVKTGLFSGSKNKINAIKEQILKLDEEIKSKSILIAKYEKDLERAVSASGGRNTSKIDSIDQKADLRISKINDEIDNIEENQLAPLLEEKAKNISDLGKQQEEFKKLNDELTQLQKKLKDAAKDSQIYSIAIKIKVLGEFISGDNLEDAIEKLDKQILELEKSKFKKTYFFFFERDYEPSETFLKLIDNKIKVLENRKNEALNKIETDISNEIDAVDLTQKDVDRAFWIWFGSMAFIISIIGSLVALAGFHLQDERMHEIRNKPIKARLGRFFRNIAWIPVYINKYIWAGVKRLKDPKIVKEKVEVEVEKIVEKPIYKDKVVYVDQEVPRETIIEKKEMVYVPLPTDDEDLLKKGPFKAPDYDKDKKK